MQCRIANTIGASESIVVILFIFLFGAPVFADTVNVSASVWGSARDSGRDGTFESISFPSSIVLQRFPNINVADRGLWEFNLSELPSGTITRVDLELIVVSTSLDRANFDLYGYAGNGTIEPSDATGGTLLAANLNGNVISQSSPIFVDVTSFIQDPAIQTAGFAGFYARYPNEVGDTVLQKQLQDPGANFGNASPWLVVELAPVPIPAAAWLFGSGLIGLFGFARHKK